ncbi:hypothetical protein L3V43_13530 [Pseudoalteromonas sp. L23]|uniref:hypothetical protein n=1 Tax=unclassified Pseudoalteromonas TaxID=194690 RepID=UPI001EF01F11|nr:MULTISPECIES: hypothetical protein [unclassified Pseudoalteromonas]MCF7514548.1 hypothetical protein [Pseudoalteromonas sp. L7]MCF7526673.1 hypothetical protein [Pseudoalteromonas sp. L23]MCX2766383.1 hypothetical protein [Pseudoalteromonas sp. B530]
MENIIELNAAEMAEVNGGVAFIIPPMVGFAFKVTGISLGTIGGSLAVYSAYRTIFY